MILLLLAIYFKVAAGWKEHDNTSVCVCMRLLKLIINVKNRTQSSAIGHLFLHHQTDANHLSHNLFPGLGGPMKDLFPAFKTVDLEKISLRAVRKGFTAGAGFLSDKYLHSTPGCLSKRLVF